MRKFKYTDILSATGIENICHFRQNQFWSNDLPMKLVQNESKKSHKFDGYAATNVCNSYYYYRCYNFSSKSKCTSVRWIWYFMLFLQLPERCCCCNCWAQHWMYFFRLFTSVGAVCFCCCCSIGTMKHGFALRVYQFSKLVRLNALTYIKITLSDILDKYNLFTINFLQPPPSPPIWLSFRVFFLYCPAFPIHFSTLYTGFRSTFLIFCCSLCIAIQFNCVFRWHSNIKCPAFRLFSSFNKLTKAIGPRMYLCTVFLDHQMIDLIIVSLKRESFRSKLEQRKKQATTTNRNKIKISDLSSKTI